MHFTVIDRKRPASHNVPLAKAGGPPLDLTSDALYRAAPVGRSKDGWTATEHDTVLYES